MVNAHIKLSLVKPSDRNVGEVNAERTVTRIASRIKVNHSFASRVEHVRRNLIAVHAS